MSQQNYSFYNLICSVY